MQSRVTADLDLLHTQMLQSVSEYHLVNTAHMLQ